MMRTAYLLDLDNLAGSGCPSFKRIRAVLESFERIYNPQSGDQVYCAGTGKSAFHAKSLRPGYSVRSGVGRDGADRLLLELATPGFLRERFERVVLGSGDWIFASLVKELRHVGLTVEVMTGRGFLSQHLYAAIAPSQRGAISPLTSLQVPA